MPCNTLLRGCEDWGHPRMFDQLQRCPQISWGCVTRLPFFAKEYSVRLHWDSLQPDLLEYLALSVLVGRARFERANSVLARPKISSSYFDPTAKSIVCTIDDLILFQRRCRQLLWLVSELFYDGGQDWNSGPQHPTLLPTPKRLFV